MVDLKITHIVESMRVNEISECKECFKGFQGYGVWEGAGSKAKREGKSEGWRCASS